MGKQSYAWRYTEARRLGPRLALTEEKVLGTRGSTHAASCLLQFCRGGAATGRRAEAGGDKHPRLEAGAAAWAPCTLARACTAPLPSAYLDVVVREGKHGLAQAGDPAHPIEATCRAGRGRPGGRPSRAPGPARAASLVLAANSGGGSLTRAAAVDLGWDDGNLQVLSRRGGGAAMLHREAC